MTDYERETLLEYEPGIVAGVKWGLMPIAKRLTAIRKLLDERYLHNPQNQFIVEPWGEWMTLTNKARKELFPKQVEGPKQRGLFE